MKFIPKLWAERADQKHVNNRSRLVSAPGANYYNGCQTSNVWRRNMSRSRESRPRGSRKQQTKITYAARARTLNRVKKIHGAKGFAFLAHSLLLSTITYLVPKWPNGRHVFLSKNKTFEVYLLRGHFFKRKNFELLLYLKPFYKTTI